MPNKLTSRFVNQKLIQGSNDRRTLISVLRGVIRHEHKLVKQINRKYAQHQQLEQYRENLKKRIATLSVFQ